MRDHANQLTILFALLLTSCGALSQGTVTANTVVLLNTTKLGAQNLSVTVDYGGTAASITGCCSSQIDSGNSGYTFGIPFQTPANAAAWGPLSMYLYNVQAGVTIYWALMQATNSPTSASPTSTYVCGGSVAAAGLATGLNTISMSGCGSPLSSQYYYIAYQNNNNGQDQPTTGVSGFCPFTSSLLTEPVSPGITFPPTGGITWSQSFGTAQNGCYNLWVPVTSTTTSTYNITDISFGNCDSITTHCDVNIPLVVAGEKLIVIAHNVSSSATHNPTSALDCTLATSACTTSTDTFTSAGTPSSYYTGSVYVNAAMYYNLNPTVGTSQVDCVFAGSPDKYECAVLKVTGLKSSGSLDQYVNQTTDSTSNTVTVGPTGTLAQAQEFAVGLALNCNLASEYSAGSFLATGSWTAQTQNGAGISPNSYGLYYQTTSSTSALSLTGTFSATPGSAPACWLGILGTFE